MSARLPEVSPYAQSKFDSEAATLEAGGANAVVVLRLPAIYGPRDMATLPYFRMIKAGLAAEPATRHEARASLLHVEDAAAAIVTALVEAPPGRVYEVGDDRPDGRSWGEIGATLAGVLGVKTRRFRAPRALLEVWHGAARLGAAVSGKAASVRSGQLNEFFHPDWVARDDMLSAATRWRARIPLEEGFAKTARWYQEKGLL
jgi:nucleoside-diphosphate-sugar epimerase